MAVVTNLTVSPVSLIEIDAFVPASGSVTVSGSAAAVGALPAIQAYVNAGKLSVTDTPVPTTPDVNPAVLSLAAQAASIRAALKANTLPIDFNGVALANSTSVYVDASFYGVKGDGTTDSSTTLQTAVTTAAAAGQPLIIGSGTILITSPISLPHGSVILASPLTVFKASISGSTVDKSHFVVAQPSTANTTTLAATPTANGNVIQPTSGTGFAVGKYISLASTTFGICTRQVVAWGGGLATLDEPLTKPFASGDTVNVLASQPPVVYFDGGGCLFTGICVGCINGQYAWRSTFKNAYASGLTGSNVDFGFGLLQGSRHSFLENLIVDATGSASSFNAGIALESENVHAIRCMGLNGTNATGIKFADAVGASAVACTGAKNLAGVAFSTDLGNNSNACVNCRVIGGNYDANTYGVYVSNGSSDNFIYVDSADNNTNDGCHIFNFGSGTVNNTISGTFRANGRYGVTVDSGAIGNKFVNVKSVNNTNFDYYIAEESSLTGLRGTSTSAVSNITVTGTGTVTIQDMDITSQPSGATFSVVGDSSFSGRLFISNSKLGLATTNGVGISCFGAGRISVRSTNVAKVGAPTGTIAFDANQGTIHMSADSDASTVATPFLMVTGSMIVDRRPQLLVKTTADSNYTFTFDEGMCAAFKDTGTLTAPRDRTLPAVYGPPIPYNNATSQTVNIKPGAVTISAGTSKTVIFDGTNYITA